MFERPPSCFPLPSRCKSNASARSKGPAVFSPFLLFAALPWVTLSICFSGKQGDRLFKPWSASPCGHHPLLLYPLLPCWAKPAHHTIYHPHHVTVSYFQGLLKLSGKGTSREVEKKMRERRDWCWCFCDKIKWNIKHIVLADTKWTWLNEKPHYINYVRPPFWGKAEAHTEGDTKS